MSGKGARVFINTGYFAALSVAFWIGGLEKGLDPRDHIQGIFEEATLIEQADDGIYSVFRERDGRKALLGWAASGTASGYGGPLVAVAGIDTAGFLTRAEIARHGETPVFFRMARVENFFSALAGRPLIEIIDKKHPVEATTGATLSISAARGSLESAVSKIARREFNIRVPSPVYPLEFGILELAAILLFALGIFALRQKEPLRESCRWFAQAAGLLIIGFWKNSPLTIAKISSFLLGYFPEPGPNLFWYFLLGGFVFSILILGTNIHCLYVCPFGALQRCVGAVGGADRKVPPWAVKWLSILRDFVTFSAVFLALLTRRPGPSSYEPFGAAFVLEGDIFQWVLLFIILTASLLVMNPWCRFFCPIGTCAKVIRSFRETVVNLWEKMRLIKESL